MTLALLDVLDAFGSFPSPVMLQQDFKNGRRSGRGILVDVREVRLVHNSSCLMIWCLVCTVLTRSPATDGGRARAQGRPARCQQGRSQAQR